MTSPLERAACDCDAPATRHRIHRADCRYFTALDRLTYENGIATNYREVVAAFTASSSGVTE